MKNTSFLGQCAVLLAMSLPVANAAEKEMIEAEPLLFVGETKKSATAKLLKIPEGALTLKSGDCKLEFKLGEDFQWQPGSRVVTLTESSRVPFKTSAELHPAPNSPNSYRAQRGTDAWLFFGPGRVLHELQPKASYATVDDWRAPKIEPATEEELGGVIWKLRAKLPVNVVVLGDSISTGADASAVSNVAPNQPGYPDLVVEGLVREFGGKVSLKNLSVGGMDSEWGLGQVAAVIAAKPDLFVLAFGMNDASGHRKPGELSRILQQIYTSVRKALPECTVLLVSPMTANSEWTGAAPELYAQYASALEQLKGPFVAVANVTKTWAALVERKQYLDLSGNGLNHPNDYGHRVYAEVILKTLGAN